jgi:hypothetical protein
MRLLAAQACDEADTTGVVVESRIEGVVPHHT